MYHLLANSFFLINNYEKALEYLECEFRYLSITTPLPIESIVGSLRLKGDVLVSSEKYAEAITEFEKILLLLEDNESEYSHYLVFFSGYIAQLYDRLGKTEQSDDYFRRSEDLREIMESDDNQNFKKKYTSMDRIFKEVLFIIIKDIY